MVNVCVLSPDMDMDGVDGHMDMDTVTVTVTDTPIRTMATITAKGLLIMDMEATVMEDIMDGVNNTDVLTFLHT